MHPLAREGVEIWRFQKCWRLIHEAHEVVAVVIAEDEHDIAWFGALGVHGSCDSGSQGDREDQEQATG